MGRIMQAAVSEQPSNRATDAVTGFGCKDQTLQNAYKHSPSERPSTLSTPPPSPSPSPLPSQPHSRKPNPPPPPPASPPPRSLAMNSKPTLGVATKKVVTRTVSVPPSPPSEMDQHSSGGSLNKGSRSPSAQESEKQVKIPFLFLFACTHATHSRIWSL